MAIKSKLAFEIPAEDGHKTNYFYGITLNQEIGSYTNVNYAGEELVIGGSIKWYQNAVQGGYRQKGIITANKDDSLGSYANYKKDFCDSNNGYYRCLYYPIIVPYAAYNSLTGKLLPRNSQYPTLINFPQLGYISTINISSQLARKYSASFSKTFKPYILDVSAIIFPYINKNDKYYFDIEGLKIIDKETQKEIFFDEENIHRPIDKLRNYDNPFMFDASQVNAKLNAWGTYKYYGTNIKAPIYNKNIEKEINYFKSQLKDNEEYINHYLSINDLPKELKIKFALNHISEFYDWNNDKRFTINQKDYYLDFDLELIKDKSFKTIEYIEIDKNKILAINEVESNIDFLEKNINKKEIEIITDLLRTNEIEILKNKYNNTYKHGDKFNVISNNKQNIMFIDNNKSEDKITRIGSIIKANEWIANHPQEIKDARNTLYNSGVNFDDMPEQQANLLCFVYLKIKDDNIYRNVLNGLNIYNTKFHRVVIKNLNFLEHFDDIPLLDTEINLLQLENNDIVYSNFRNEDKKIIDAFNLTQASLLQFPFNSNISNLTIDNSFDGSYSIYYHKLFVYKDNILKELYLPILSYDGVINNLDGYIYKNTYKYLLKEIKKNELLNYSNVIEKDGKYYYYKNVSKLLDEPFEYDYEIENEDGSITTRKEIEAFEPHGIIKELETITLPEIAKFPLSIIEFKKDYRLKNAIYNIKNNNINGIFIEYIDKNDGKTKLKHINTELENVLHNISDISYTYDKVMPYIPFYSKLDYLVPYCCSSRYSMSLAKRDWRWFGMLFGGASYINFYYSLDNRINNYMKKQYGIHPREHNYAINQDFGKDIINSPKKLAKRYTNEKLLNYSKSYLPDSFNSSDIHKNAFDSYSAYYESPNHGQYGAYLSIRFNFAIYFNKFVRRTKLLSRMGYMYLDYYFKDTQIGIDKIISLYPPDRLSFPEKKLLLKCKRMTITQKELDSMKTNYLTTFDYYTGEMVFFNKIKKQKYILYINTLYPNWKLVFFKNKTIFSKTSADINDLVPLEYTDYYIPKTKELAPIDTYQIVNGKYSLKLKSYYYDTPIKIRFKNIEGKILTRTINFWKKPSGFCCFYTPYNKDEYSFNYSTIDKQKFILKNIDDYLRETLDKKSLIELTEIYNKIFNSKINVVDNIDFIDYKNNLSDLLKPLELDLENITDFEQTKSYNYIPLQGIRDNTSYINIPLKQREALYKYFNNNFISIKKEENTLTKIECIKHIIDKLKLEELPPEQIILVSDFSKYFINYNKEGTLAKIFTEREVYELGFKNYLVTDIVFDYNEPTVFLEVIQNKIGSFLQDLDIQKGVFKCQSFILPMPQEVYKKLPYYCKLYCKVFNTMVESYRVQSIPTKDSKIFDSNQIYKVLTEIITIIIGVILFIVGIVLVATGVAAGVGVALIIGGINIITPTIFSMLAKLFPEHKEIFSGLSAVFQAIGIVVGFATGSISTLPTITATSIQMATLVIQSINIALQLANNIITLVKQEELNQINMSINNKIEEYNKSVDGLYDFIEENEFNDIMLENSSLDFIIAKNTPTNREDSFYNTITSLDLLYNEVDSYYDKRLQ